MLGLRMLIWSYFSLGRSFTIEVKVAMLPLYAVMANFLRQTYFSTGGQSSRESQFYLLSSLQVWQSVR